MNNEHKKTEPIRELEQLAQFFVDHGREDLAREITEQVARLQKKGPHYIESRSGREVDSLSPLSSDQLKLDS